MNLTLTYIFVGTTNPETNVAPENQWLEDSFPFGGQVGPNFQVLQLLDLGSVGGWIEPGADYGART